MHYRQQQSSSDNQDKDWRQIMLLMYLRRRTTKTINITNKIYGIQVICRTEMKL